MLRSFPLLGVGAGGFDAVEPYLKQTDVNSSTAQSSLLQWGAEFGIAGIVVGLAALAWAAHRLPSAWRNVGEADRPLAAGLVGAAAGFLLLSCIHSTVQYPSTALCVTAIGAATHRWLSGATDLFVDEPLVG
jgi:O-antigen ligase